MQILELADTGQLGVVREVQSVVKDACGQFVAAAADGSHFDRVFSAGSAGNAPDPLAAPLISSLLQSGHGRAHPFGGLDVERTTSQLLNARGRPQPRLYAVGTTTSGAFQVLNGYAVLKRRSAHIADAMLKHHEARRSRGLIYSAEGAVIANAVGRQPG